MHVHAAAQAVNVHWQGISASTIAQLSGSQLLRLVTALQTLHDILSRWVTCVDGACTRPCLQQEFARQ